MPAVSTQECYAHADRLRNRVILITGAGSGFGRATALKFTELGAKVVLGDVDTKGLAETVKQVTSQSGSSSVVSARCDVTSWDDQVALFEAGAKAFGNIDIVLPNAGVSEIGRFDPRLDGDATKLTKPNLKTIEIDLIGVLYTTRIALWYFINDKRKEPGLRSIAFTGSMSTFYGSDGVGYGVSKAGVLGIMKGIVAACDDLKVRVATICPYFSSESPPFLLILRSLPRLATVTPTGTGSEYIYPAICLIWGISSVVSTIETIPCFGPSPSRDPKDGSPTSSPPSLHHASSTRFARAPDHVTSKHSLRSYLDSLTPETNILDDSFVHPYPALGFAEVSDVVNAFVAAITDPNQKTNYSAYLIPDKWGVFRMAATGQL